MDNLMKNKIKEKVHEKLKPHNTVREDINEIHYALDLLLKEDLNLAGSINGNPDPKYSPALSHNQGMPKQEGNTVPPSVKGMINNIRKISLEGIKELSDNSTSDEYAFFKKVWDMADKVQENKRNENLKRQ